MRIRIDPGYAESLRRHLCATGFPAIHVDPGQLDVLFPGCPGIFPAAAELDLWEYREETPGAAATLEIDR